MDAQDVEVCDELTCNIKCDENFARELIDWIAKNPGLGISCKEKVKDDFNENIEVQSSDVC